MYSFLRLWISHWFSKAAFDAVIFGLWVEAVSVHAKLLRIPDGNPNRMPLQNASEAKYGSI